MHRKEEGDRGAGSGPGGGEEVLCLLARGWGFKGSGRILAPALGPGGLRQGGGAQGGLGAASSPRLWPQSGFFLGVPFWDFQLEASCPDAGHVPDPGRAVVAAGWDRGTRLCPTPSIPWRALAAGHSAMARPGPPVATVTTGTQSQWTGGWRIWEGAELWFCP